MSVGLCEISVVQFAVDFTADGCNNWPIVGDNAYSCIASLYHVRPAVVDKVCDTSVLRLSFVYRPTADAIVCYT